MAKKKSAKKKVSKKATKKTATKTAKRTTKKAAKKTTKATRRGTSADDDGEVATKTTKKTRRAASLEPVTAETLATRQKSISVSEFFAKNRHLLGFDSPARALLTTIKEAVDNSLDACEEAQILPDVTVELHQKAEDRFIVVVQDNGPGVTRAQVPRIFGRLLYGSKFHTRKQSRGQQGIGISAAGMYGYLTTGKPILVTVRTSARSAAHRVSLTIDTAKNIAVVHRDEEVEVEWKRGTRIELELEATYKKGKHSVDAFLEQVALANPHVQISYLAPGDKEPTVYERVTKSLPEPPKEILPHPHGVELGILIKMLKDTKAKNLKSFLSSEFSRVTPAVADRIIEATGAGKKSDALRPTTRTSTVSQKGSERLHQAIANTKLMAPPTNCLSPIGAELIEKALKRNFEPDFLTSVTRAPSVYRGNPFQVECGLAYGGSIPGDELATLYRFANRVPLQYQQSACAMSKAVISVPWRNYEIQQSRGALPTAPLTIMVHIASVWVPFTSESKKAVAHYDEILKELRLALMDAGRKLAIHLRRRRREADAQRKYAYIEKYIPQIGLALQDILELSDPQRDKAVKSLGTVLEKSRKM